MVTIWPTLLSLAFALVLLFLLSNKVTGVPRKPLSPFYHAGTFYTASIFGTYLFYCH